MRFRVMIQFYCSHHKLTGIGEIVLEEFAIIEFCGIQISEEKSMNIQQAIKFEQMNPSEDVM